MSLLTRTAAAMRGGPLAAWYPYVRDAVLALLRIKAAIAGGCARVIALSLGVLPTSVKARVKQSFRPTARLDYARHRILLHADSADALYRTAAVRKEPETVEWIENYVKPGDVLYDVGANVGAYSLIAAKHCEGNVTVLAFEPSFATYNDLCRNVVLNGCERSVVPFLMCLTAAPGIVRFGYSSLEPGSALHVTGSGTTGEPQGAVYAQQIPGLSIDTLVSQFGCPVPTHIKIDVDGTELDILQGAEQTLGDPRLRTLQVEVSPQDRSAADVRALLENRGFHLVSRTKRGGGVRWSNDLFVRV